MLLPLKPICPSRQARRGGTCIIFIQYCKIAAQKTILNVGIAIPPRVWHKKFRRVLDSLPTEYGNPETLNKEIRRLYRIAEKIITFALKERIADQVAFIQILYKVIRSSKKLPLRLRLILTFFTRLKIIYDTNKKRVTKNDHCVS